MAEINDSDDLLSLVLDFKTLLVEKPVTCDKRDNVREFVWEDGDQQDLINEDNIDQLLAELDEESRATRFEVIGDAKFTKLRRIQVLPAWISSAERFDNDIKPTSLSSINSIQGLCRPLKKKLKRQITSFFPVQHSFLSFLMPLTAKCPIFPPRDVAIASPTGSGKTLCYILPILNGLQHHDASSVFAVVIAPSTLLATQIYNEFRKYNPFSAQIALCAGVHEYNVERKKMFPNGATTTKCSVIVATPNRLVQHLTDLRGKIDLSKLKYLVIDEADKMKNTARMEWLNLVEERARVFTPNSTSMDKLQSKTQNRWLQRILVSATLSLDAERLFIWNLRCPKLFCADVIGTESTSADGVQEDGVEHKPVEMKPKKLKHTESVFLPSTLKHKVVMSDIRRKPLDIYCWIQQNPEWQKVLVFVNSKAVSKRLTVLLDAMLKDKKVGEISAGLYGPRRQRLLQQFSEGKLNVLVCTDSAGRGVDIEAIDCVINYDIPKDNRVFVHRAGRTARAGKEGVVLTFTTKEERADFTQMLKRFGFLDKTNILKQDDLSSAKDRSRYKKALEKLESVFSESKSKK